MDGLVDRHVATPATGGGVVVGQTGIVNVEGVVLSGWWGRPVP